MEKNEGNFKKITIFIVVTLSISIISIITFQYITTVIMEMEMGHIIGVYLKIKPLAHSITGSR